jgi:hypothetical protein
MNRSSHLWRHQIAGRSSRQILRLPRSLHRNAQRLNIEAQDLLIQAMSAPWCLTITLHPLRLARATWERILVTVVLVLVGCIRSNPHIGRWELPWNFCRASLDGWAQAGVVAVWTASARGPKPSRKPRCYAGIGECGLLGERVVRGHGRFEGCRPDGLRSHRGGHGVCTHFCS